MEVIILTALDSVSEITSLINKRLREGWILQGNLIVVASGQYNDTCKYVQMMSRSL